MRFYTLLFMLFSLLLTCKASQPPAEARYVTATSGLNLRAEPSASSRAVVLLAYGSQVTVLQEATETTEWQGLAGRWTKVRAESGEGWAFGAFLSKEKPDALIGAWGACVTMVNIGRLQIMPNGTFSLVLAGMPSNGSYSRTDTGMVIDGLAYTLREDGTMCAANPASSLVGVACWCRR